MRLLMYPNRYEVYTFLLSLLILKHMSPDVCGKQVSDPLLARKKEIDNRGIKVYFQFFHNMIAHLLSALKILIVLLHIIGFNLYDFGFAPTFTFFHPYLIYTLIKVSETITPFLVC